MSAKSIITTNQYQPRGGVCNPVSESPLSYEQLKPSLFKWAAHYASPQFDLWEMVNEAWASRYVRQVTNVKFASLVVRFVMLNYIRTKEHRRAKRQPLMMRLPDEFLRRMEGKGEHNTVENREWVEKLLNHPQLTELQRYLLRRYYLEGETQLELAEAEGLPYKVVNYQINAAVKKLRQCYR